MTIDWENLKIDYEVNYFDKESLATKYKCKVATIEKKIIKSGWLVNKSEEHDGNSDKYDVDEVLESHRRLWRLIRNNMESIAKTNGESITLKDLKVEADIFSTVIKGERGAWEIDKDDGVNDYGNGESWLNVFRQMEEATVLRTTAKDLEGK